MTDTTDQQAPETDTGPATPVAVGPRKASAMPLVVGGVLAAVIGFAVAQVLPVSWRSPDASALQSQRDVQTVELATLKADVDRLSKAPGPDPTVSDRLAAVEAALAGTSPAPDLGPLTARLDALAQTVAALLARPVATGQTDPALLIALRAEVEALKSGGIASTAKAEVSAAIDAKLAEATVRIDAIKAEAEALATATLRHAALQRIMAALDSGAPYGSAIADLAEISLPLELSENAASGLPTLQDLRHDFPDAARAALDAAITANIGDNWTDRATAFLRGQTGARSLTPREGDDPDAVLSRAEAALVAGDLTTALAEIAALPAVSQTAMADWLTRAQLHQKAIGQVQALLDATDR